MAGTMLRSILSAASLVLVAAVCTEAPTSLPPDSPTILESGELLSGGEGVLVSEAFSSIELAAQTDSLGEPVEHRWSNFGVLFAGDTVDSWRVGSARIAFRVPVVETGDYSVRVGTPDYAADPLGVQVLGLRYTAVLDDCDHIGPRVVVPVSPEEALFFTWCSRYSADKNDGEGTALLLPSLLSNGLRWLEGAYGEDTDVGYILSRMFAAGVSYRPGHAVLEEPVFVEEAEYTPPDSAPPTWVWRLGSDPAPVSRIPCPRHPHGEYMPLYTAAEVAPGVCITLDESGRFRRNGGEPIYSLGYGTTYQALRVSARGTVAPKHTLPWNHWREDWPVISDEGTRIYTVPEYQAVTGVAFDPSGDSLYVAADVGGEGESWVLDLRDADTGVLLRREQLSNCVADIAFAQDRLWILSCDDRDDGVQWLEIRSPRLDPERAVAVGPVQAVATPLRFVMPDTNGRRAYLFSVQERSLWLAVVDVF